jgi:hypothetical protein
MSEEVSEEVKEEEPTQEQLEEAHRYFLSEIMSQLTDSDRFNRFFKVNYEVQQHFDHATKVFNITLIERPPELAAIHLQEMLQEHAKDNTPAISMPTDAEIAALKKDFLQ